MSFSMANLKIELSKLDSEAWPGALDIEKEKLMLINEKEELLKELQFITPQKRSRDELERLEAERQRLEEELMSVRGLPSRALAERFVFSWGQGDISRGLELSVAPVVSEVRNSTRECSFCRAMKHTLLVPRSISSPVSVRNAKVTVTDVE